MSAYYVFYIKAYSPETIPMARLSEYLTELSRMLGNAESVHFSELREGSTGLAYKVDQAAVPKVQKRIVDGCKDRGFSRAVGNINDMLRDDNADGYIEQEDATIVRIYEFSGIKFKRPKVYGPIVQQGSLQGELVSVGGRDQTSHIILQDGDRFHTNISIKRHLAAELAQYLYQGTVRVHGKGFWIRDEEESWTLKSFTADSYDALENSPLDQVIASIKTKIGGSWGASQDPLRALRDLREDP